MIRISLLLLIIGYCTYTSYSQDNRAQYPPFLAKAYFGVNMGYMHYPFTNHHLPANYTAESITIPHMAVGIALLGYRFNRYISAQITYMRPVDWVKYHNINGDGSSHSVYMNVGGLTLKGRLPLNTKFALYGETGMGIITRKGFDMAGTPVVKNAEYASILLGAGLYYRLNDKWELTAGVTYNPTAIKKSQPYTRLFSVGFQYNMSTLSAEKVQETKKAAYYFPRHLVQVGLSTNTFGYSVNNFLSEQKFRIFWGGGVHIKNGLSLRYQRNVFHTKKVFALDIGTSLGIWKTDLEKQGFYTVSVFPTFRFNVLRLKKLDGYFFYSVAGPTYISKVMLDKKLTGRHFTFQDQMGIGAFLGKRKNVNLELNIAHYSNGNIFTANPGLKIPLTISIGKTFNP